ncbi:MAG: acyltransferase [Prevotellaceae bacterium]|nr:acyltransferase [Prevotellaceae bacterium]
MNTPTQFDDIRPFTSEELPSVIDQLLNDENFRNVIGLVFPKMPFEEFAAKAKQCKSPLDFQKAFCYPFLKDLAAKKTTGVTMDCSAISKQGNYTFISNHRDIVLDSAFLSMLLIDNDFGTTTEIAIGDNLLIYPWIEKLVRVNKSFIVHRGLTIRQQLSSSIQISAYMHYAIQQKKENIWIAQRQGRAKDSNDITQRSIIKMFGMAGDGDLISRLKQLNLAPTAISYEYDPCDYLKAKEFQQKRDNPNHKKAPNDDLINMNTGIFGWKGKVVYKPAQCLNQWLDTLDPSTPNNDIYGLLKDKINLEIHKNYTLYPNNYVAVDLLSNNSYWADQQKYTLQDKQNFEQYLSQRISLVDLENPDTEFLRQTILAMYANPLLNYIKAISAQ